MRFLRKVATPHNKRSRNLGFSEAGIPLTASDVTRFWGKVRKDGPTPKPELGPCWQWTAGCFQFGYGQFSVTWPGTGRGRSKPVYAHRVAWQLSHGAIPEGKSVLHHCDNAPCVNPAHLFIGDHAANMRDAASKGRLHKPRPKRQKLTDGQVNRIVDLVTSGRPQIEVAQELGIARSLVSLIMTGKRRQYRNREEVA